MQYGQFEQSRVSKRRLLTTALTGVFCIVPATNVFLGTATAASNESTPMTPIHLINALKLIGKPVCMDVADTLAKASDANSAYDLHLRRAGLDTADALVLASGMLHSNTQSGSSLSSFSASFNPQLGDAGVVVLADAFPTTMTELGLVDCEIGDNGGRAILDWARKAPELRMICVEGNRFSSAMRLQFQKLAQQERQILVMV